MLAIVAGCCLLLQAASASLQQRSLETPNSATDIARSLVDRGEYAVADLRAFQLPAEPWYLAAGLMLLPDEALPYLHVPVAVLLVTAIAAAAMAIGGPAVGLAAGLVAALDPFVLAHGAVWDDAFLAAALEWSLFAIVLHIARGTLGLSPRLLLVVASLAATAAMTRTLSQLLLVAVAGGLIVHPRLRALRAAGLAVVLGVAVALAAWGVRNQTVLGTFLVGTTHDGEAFFESNCAYTREGIRDLGYVGFERECSEAQFVHAAGLDEVNANRQFRRYGLEYIRTHPLEFVKTAAFKLAVSLSGIDFGRPVGSPKNVVAVGSSLLTLVVGAVGLWQLGRRTPPGLVRDAFLLVTVVTAALTLLMLGIGPTGLRYRLTLTGALFVGCAGVITALFPRLSWRITGSEPARAISR